MEALGINPIQIVVQVINFLILLFVLKRFLYAPVLKMLAERQEKVVATQRLQGELEGDRKQIDTERQGVINQARQEAELIISEARQRGEQLAGQIKETATKQASDILAQGEQTVKIKETEMRSQLQKTVVQTALAVSEQVLADTLTTEQRDQITNQAVERFIKDE